MMRGRRRRGRYGRTPLPVKIGHVTKVTAFRPEPEEQGPPIPLEPAELEVLRLLDIEDLSQEDAGERMGVSRVVTTAMITTAENMKVRISPADPSG